MNVEPVVVAMVCAIEMLDHATEEEADSSFAVEVQTTMGEYLNELTRDDLREFCDILVRIADQRATDDPLIAEYCRRMAAGYSTRG